MVHVPDDWSNKMSAELCREADARDADVSFDLLVVNREGLVEGQRERRLHARQKCVRNAGATMGAAGGSDKAETLWLSSGTARPQNTIGVDPHCLAALSMWTLPNMYL